MADVAGPGGRHILLAATRRDVATSFDDLAGLDRSFYRFVAELLLVGLVAYLLFGQFGVPALRATAPELFTQPVADTGARELPETPLGWARFGLLSLVWTAFMYVRLVHTALGEAVFDNFRPADAPERE